MQAENGVRLYILMNNSCLSLKEQRGSKYFQEMRNVWLIDFGNLMTFLTPLLLHMTIGRKMLLF